MQGKSPAMSAKLIAAPGLAFGLYPERRPKEKTAWTDAAAFLHSALRFPAKAQERRYHVFLQQVHGHVSALRNLAAGALHAKVRELRAQLARDGLTDALVAESFALIREASFQRLGLAHFDTQIIAARIMLNNQLAEMETGEGKTLAVALAAATAAMAGIPVHVITANDYLVARDAEFLRPVYESLGLTLGMVLQAMDKTQRRAAYACGITYCTARELAFDYLHDRLLLKTAKSDLHRRLAQLAGTAGGQPQPVLRGLCMAIVDEADSILIDEAVTPLILAQVRVDASQTGHYGEALNLAGQLKKNQHYQLDHHLRSAALTPAGREVLATLAPSLGGLWKNTRHREEVVGTALAALHLHHADRHYLVRDGRVYIIDEPTGRIAHGRQWSRGLHQLIELKEGCQPSGEQQTVAQITYQRFFPRYLRLAGTSGTLDEARYELLAVYGVEVARVPLHRPSRRHWLPLRLFATAEAKWKAVVGRITEMRSVGRPVLVGTDSVADSEHLSRLLHAASLPYTLLNARQDSEEAGIIAQAGKPGQITIATNMAGRGTDIPLEQDVARRGGLHVICCQHNSARRIDRQLHGRCGRQGDPGSVDTLLSLHDPLIAKYLPARLVGWLTWRNNNDGPFSSWLGVILAALPQRLEERRQRRQRAQLLEQDALFERSLAFGGPSE